MPRIGIYKNNGAPAPQSPNITPTKGGGVRVGNVKTTREMLDMNGNVIDPRTKQIIKRNVEEKLIIN